MKAWQYFTVLLLAVACFGLSIATVLTARANTQLQQELQGLQSQINRSVLGQQAQQVVGNLLQDMARVSTQNAAIRKLLSKHGYNVQASPDAAEPAAVPTPEKSKSKPDDGADKKKD